jgi:hypothetical protein
MIRISSRCFSVSSMLKRPLFRGAAPRSGVGVDPLASACLFDGTTAHVRIPSVPGNKQERQQWVEIPRSPSCRRMTAPCALRSSTTSRSPAVLTLARLAAGRQPENDVAAAFASARLPSSSNKLRDSPGNDDAKHERERRQEGDQSSGLFARESASITMSVAASRRSGFPVLPWIAAARECNHFSIIASSKLERLTLPMLELT